MSSRISVGQRCLQPPRYMQPSCQGLRASYLSGWLAGGGRGGGGRYVTVSGAGRAGPKKGGARGRSEPADRRGGGVCGAVVAEADWRRRRRKQIGGVGFVGGFGGTKAVTVWGLGLS
jgi:hypothetical protein